MKKAQVSLEFMIIASVALVIFLIFLSGYYEKIGPLQSNRKRIKASQLSSKSAQSINDVFLAGEGTSKTFYLPDYLPGNQEYNITVYPDSRSVYIDWGEGEAGAKFLTTNITGNLSKGRNKVTNEGGGIAIE